MFMVKFYYEVFRVSMTEATASRSVCQLLPTAIFKYMITCIHI